MLPREIGSEFWDVPTSHEGGGAFPAWTEWFVSGRSALSAVIEDVHRCGRQLRSAALPSWCCESMVAPIVSAGVEVSFYPVTIEGGSLRQHVAPTLGSDLILVMGYFGMSDPPDVPEGYRGIVVEDVTHSLLSEGRCHRADYRFGSLRKWCGVWTGGFAWRCDGIPLRTDTLPCDIGYVALRRTAMELKSSYISTGEGNKGYLATFAEAEEWLDGPISAMRSNERDIELAQTLDMTRIWSSRRRNASVLRESLRDSVSVRLLFDDLREGDCPLFVPILSEDRASLRRYLTANDVYCPVHWPVSRLHELDERTRVPYDNCLSLVCDQRYDADDMQRICDLVRKWQKTG